jgi:hypothetical protein
MKITFVYTSDYVGAYIDGQLVCSGDDIRHEDLLEAVAEHACFDLEIVTGDVDDEIIEDLGDFPEDLEDLGEIC